MLVFDGVVDATAHENTTHAPRLMSRVKAGVWLNISVLVDHM